MSRRDDLEKLITKNSRRLQKLKEQKAILGITADPNIEIEIEDIEARLRVLQSELERGSSLQDQLVTSIVSSSSPTELISELEEWKLIHNESQVLLNVLNIPLDYLTAYRFKPDPERIDEAGFKWQEACVPKLKSIPDRWQFQYASTPALDDLREQIEISQLNEITKQLMRTEIQKPEFKQLYLTLLELKGTLWDILTVSDKKIMVLIETLRPMIGD